jgi:tripeptide aminopeptidase
MTGNATPQLDEARALGHLMELLAVEGLSGREARVVRAVRAKARAAGCKTAWIRTDDAHHRIRRDYEIGNLIIKLPGTVKGPRRLFSGHLDTVPLCRGAVPLRRGRRIVSRGKTGLGGDNRTAVACLVTTLETILRHKLDHPPLTFLFTVGEEQGLRGSRAVKVADLGRPRLGFNIDGGEPAKLVVGALGADRWDVEVLGRASHAGQHPDHGVSAALIASKAIADAAARGWFGKIVKGRRQGTANVGRIEGGEATNQVTDRVFVRGESRSHNPAFVSVITETWRRAFTTAAAKVRNHRGVSGRIRFKAETDYHPFRLAEDEPVVQMARAAADSLGLDAGLKLANGGLDANHLTRKGVPTVTLGAGQHAAHTVDEYIEVPEYLDCCRLTLMLALGRV